MRILVLAGGLGTRLRPVLGELPKPMAPVHGKPFIYYQLINWIEQGFRDFTFLLNYKSDIIISYLSSLRGNELSQCNIDWIVEPSLLGTGGAIAYAVQQLSIVSNFIVLNADTWLDSGLQNLSSLCPATMSVIHVDDTSRFGQVHFDSSHVITSFTEKKSLSNQSSGWINSGQYLLSPEYFNRWDGLPLSLEQDLFPHLVTNSLLKVDLLSSNFIDIGIPTDYQRFCDWVENSKNSSL